MNMNMSTLCATNKNYNEDVIGFSSKAAWVIDGVTGLYQNRIPGWDSEAQWFANAWNRYLVSNIDDEHRTIANIIADGEKFIASEFYRCVPDADADKTQRPGATIALVRKIDDVLQYYILGDCYIATQTKNKTQLLTDDRVGVVEQKQAEELQRLQTELHISIDEARAQAKAFFKDTRSVKNTKDGYWILEAEANTAKHAVTGKISVKNDTQVLIMSDGFYRIVDTFHYIKDTDILFANINRYGLQAIFDSITYLEDLDPNGEKFIRTKKSDDCSAILFTAKPTAL